MIRLSGLRNPIKPKLSTPHEIVITQIKFKTVKPVMNFNVTRPTLLDALAY